MSTRNLKTNIAVHLAVLLILAMILIDFVVIIVTQKAFLRSEIERGYHLLSGIVTQATVLSQSNDVSIHPGEYDIYSAILTEVGSSCVMVMSKQELPIYFNGKHCELKDMLGKTIRQAIQTGKKTRRYSGSAWGVFWLKNRDLILSEPLFHQGNIVGGAGIVFPLKGLYESLRRIQYILWIYIFINTIVFTIIGIYRLTSITVRPLQRLVRRAEEYQGNETVFFLHEKGNNDFGKLSKALNRMLQHIAEDKEKLKTAVNSLEKANVDLRQAQKEMVRAEKLASVGRLSAGIAHEIGNPIGIVVGYLELLKQEGISDEERKEFILRTEGEIKKIDKIIRQLLDFSKPSNEEMEAVSVHTIIEDTLDACQFHPLMSDIDLDLKLSAKNDWVIADPNQLRQVFLNLFINAADSISSAKGHSQGKITISSENFSNIPIETRDRSNVLKIDYADNGVGIPEENLGNIFDPFYTTKTPGKGTGLGLSVCFMIIEGIGGKIEAASKEGSGTTITVYLPLSSESKN